MKTALYIFLPIVLFFFNGRNNNSFDTATAYEASNDINQTLQGTWELVNYYNYQDNEVVDTVQNQKGYRQVKIYTKNKVMWSRQVPRDSTEYFGYGSYTINEGMLIETLEYGSESMLQVIDTMRVFSFELQLKPNSYSQIEIGPEGDRIYSENYVRIE